MLGIQDIASYIPDKRISNYERKEKFGINDHFIEKKLGVKSVAIKGEDEDTSDLCVLAFENLKKKVQIDIEQIKLLTVVTQNPDRNIPHTSAIVHGKLGFSQNCACFDISLGCSGFVYGLKIALGFMRENNLKYGLLFTADPYSKIVDSDDKNTSLLFGDAAAVTLLTDTPVFQTGKFTYGTIGQQYQELTNIKNKLYMNGGAIFNFAAKLIPSDVKELLLLNEIPMDSIDSFVFHQGSKFIVDTISKNLECDPAKVAFDIYEYGNTVSSSIPIILEKELKNLNIKTTLISGFGVGLSWSSGILKRI